MPALAVLYPPRRSRNSHHPGPPVLLVAIAALLFNPLANIDPAAAAPRESSAQTRFEQTYRATQTLQVSFLETYEENGRVVRSEAGTAYFRRPGRMRFEYAAPEKNLFLVDGKTAWFYVPADHTATRVPAKESSDWKTPLALLAGEARLSRICARVQPATTEKPTTPDGVVLQCTLKGAAGPATPSSAATGLIAASPAATGPNSARVFLEVAPISGQLMRVLIRDSGGVTVDFHFKNWDFNPSLPDALFRFSPPLGTAIVSGELPAALATAP